MNADLVNDLLRHVRQQFYPDNEKLFFQERNMLIQAVTYPARWFQTKGMPYPEDRYRELVEKIIREIMHHGDTAKIRSFGRYLLKAVQDRMKHHGDHFLAEAKSLRRALDDVTGRLKATDAQRAADAFIESLAAAHKVVSAGAKKRKTAAVAEPLQLDFLGAAQPLQKVRR